MKRTCTADLRGSADVDEFGVRGAVMAGDGLAEALRAVGARAVDQDRMEEDRVALLHRQVDARVVVVAANAVVHLVHAVLKCTPITFEINKNNNKPSSKTR